MKAIYPGSVFMDPSPSWESNDLSATLELERARCLVRHLLTNFFTAKSCEPPPSPLGGRTTTCKLSATIFSHLPQYLATVSSSGHLRKGHAVVRRDPLNMESTRGNVNKILILEGNILWFVQRTPLSLEQLDFRNELQLQVKGLI
jgi:hypothetical protein